MRFKVGRGTPTSLTTVARGPLEVPEASTVNTFPVRAPVQAGDVIGFSKPAGACDSPQTYKKLKVGKHRFQVTATDLAGNADPTPARKTFKIKP